ncbi:MAG: electron transfer flavoprotein subunit alpha/FixB family protein [Candidatus Hodarchaeales archaeon]|jgi:electron transfer flavoprotein alpha subunit
MAKILIILENAKGKIVGLTKECLTVVQKLAGELEAEVEGVILGQDIGSLAQEAGTYGVKKVYKVDDAQFSGINILYHTRTIEALIKETNPTLVIGGASLYGQELVPRLAARFEKAMFASVKSLTFDDGEYEGIHPLFEEKLFVSMEGSAEELTFATILGGNNPEVEPDDGLSAEVVDFSPLIQDSDKRESFVEETIAKVSVDITKAKLLVSGGRGVGSAEKYAVITEAAKALGGEVGASRAAVDAGWVAYDHEIGQTGKTVTPDFYIACGISGAIQHLVGMRNSKTIIVINTDEEAPIIEMAHYAIIGDLHEVLPELMKSV